MDKRFDVTTEEGAKKIEAFKKLLPGEKTEQTENDWQEAILLNNETFYDKFGKEKDPKQKELLELAIKISEAVKNSGGLALVVGGYARDEALRRLDHEVIPNDIDLEVYGLDFDELMLLLNKFGEPKVVGESFGVIELNHLDISIPRRDSKSRGKKEDKIEGEPNLSIRESVRRRDFTINSLALNPLTGEMVDKFGGLKDMSDKILRATDQETFGDDPLRVLRAAQFVARFGFKIAPETVKLCRSFNLAGLAPERIGREWIKLLLRSSKPSLGLEAAKDLRVIEKLHPELQALIGTPQDVDWHPEGDVWIHTNMVVDAAADIVRRENLAGKEALVIMFGALCHDLGKPSTTITENGRIKSHAHSEAGLEPTRSFLNSLKISDEVKNKVIKIVADHLFPSLGVEAGESAVKRLAARLSPANIKELVLVGEADHRGRALPWQGYPEGQLLIEKAEKLQIKEQRPQPLVLGRHLIDKGLNPGPNFGKILNWLYEAQLDGKFENTENGLKYFDEVYPKI